MQSAAKREVNQRRAAQVLNRLLTVLYRSFPVYLVSADPWMRDEDRPTMEVVRRIAAEQQQMAAQIADTVIEMGARIDLGDFPMEFTSKNFLAMDYLLSELVRYQKRDLAVIERCVQESAELPAARTLAEQTLALEKAHLKTLEQLNAGKTR